MSETVNEWMEILDPQILRPRLIGVSLFLAAWEMLNASIVDHLKAFFCPEGRKGGVERYKEKVLTLNKSPLYASLRWLEENGALSSADVDVYTEIKNCRNALVHEMPSFICGERGHQYLEVFEDLVGLLNKIETWWILEVELPTDPDYDGRPVEAGQVIPGPIMMVRVMLDVALGNEEEANSYRMALGRGDEVAP